jgi:hypothetical protein
LAVDRGERVGFFWGDDTNTARPDAWCLQCEQKLRASMVHHPSSGSAMLASRFFAPNAGDEAKHICGGDGKQAEGGLTGVTDGDEQAVAADSQPRWSRICPVAEPWSPTL